MPYKKRSHKPEPIAPTSIIPNKILIFLVFEFVTDLILCF